MKWIGLHCDTLAASYRENRGDMVEMPKAQVDIKRLKQGDAAAMVFAIFLPPRDMEKPLCRPEPTGDEEYIRCLMAAFHETMRRGSGDIAPALNAAEIGANTRAGKMSGLLSFEDGRAINGSLDRLKYFYDQGIRMIALTWNNENCFGFPNSTESAVMEKGLKPFGIEAVRMMNDLGMVVDVSHLSDGGFMDVAVHCGKPFIASHSNCRSLCNVPRNMTDGMLRILAEKGGAAGINFVPEFLNDDPSVVKTAGAAVMSAHIRRMIEVGGEDLPAIGTDFDGFEGQVDISGAEKMGLLFDQLHRDNFTDSQIEKIAYKNALRVFEESMA